MLRSAFTTLMLVLVAVALAACESAREAGAVRQEQLPGVEAVLLPVNASAAQGTVKFVDRGDGVTAMISLANLIPGPYRVAIHERGNCSSPNGFSAGAPWAPPGATRPAGELIPEISIGPNGNGQMSAFVKGVRTRSNPELSGRSVVVHMGAQVDTTVVPDRSNRLVLCGVIGPVRSFLN